MNIIGLSGYARAGKDTVGRILVEQHGFTRISFADKLREVARAINPFVYAPDLGDRGFHRLRTVLLVKDWEAAKEYPDVRRLLQNIGTEAGRQILGENIWVDAALKNLQPRGNYVVTDVRFPNEYRAVNRLGGELWRVVRPGYEATNGHVSETALDKFSFDRDLWNDGDLDQLAAKVGALLSGMESGQEALGRLESAACHEEDEIFRTARVVAKTLYEEDTQSAARFAEAFWATVDGA